MGSCRRGRRHPGPSIDGRRGSEVARGFPMGAEEEKSHYGEYRDLWLLSHVRSKCFGLRRSHNAVRLTTSKPSISWPRLRISQSYATLEVRSRRACVAICAPALWGDNAAVERQLTF